MVSLKELVMKCKQQCDKLISIFDDSHNYETAVETFMRENEEVSPKDSSNKVEMPDYQEKSLYVNPIDETGKVIDCENVNNVNITDEDDSKHRDERINRVDELIDSSVDIPPYIDLEKNRKESISENLDTNTSLTNNEFIDNNMLKSIIELVEELDHILAQSNDSNAQSIMQYCQDRLFEILFNNGCARINSDTAYDSERHTVRPLSIISKGTHISEYVRDGVLFNGEVLLKALVKIELPQ